MPMLTVKLPANMEKRLKRLSQRTGRPKAYYAKKAIGEFMEEQEDYLISISRLEEHLPSIPLAEVVKQLGQDR